ncbi:biotin--[acetyl-CoA-carboxylase] ligase [Candidatus Liberibacter sp.]|uniref:biotin--[acetyl-CoA-carboxylase] ligase n=1 Tax=Candidatus Liberibacter sp. TaxID=34022 RepID=UPI0015F684A8|nr:biotin--[acetyl-CoA-carboxylase] ligase [Candidatus Liberibacter sp.]MBA5724322.1 biotin--[acetyl-CoA-carboxylase] ligase [Candidatus Liberibacter sp.]
MVLLGSSQWNVCQNFRYEFFDTIFSTNIECINRALSGDPGGLWIVASRQTNGRGRRGKVWVSDAGNLYASLLLVDSLSKDLLALLPFAIAVAVRSAIANFAPIGVDIKIKWPNDLLIFQRKVAGILIETSKLKNDLQAIVIGIGINIAHCPKNISYPVTFLQREGIFVELKDILQMLFQEVSRILVMWKKGDGQAEIMRIWRCFASGIGESITINLPNNSISGRFIGVDDFGHLLLEEENGCFREFSTGDIFG